MTRCTFSRGRALTALFFLWVLTSCGGGGGGGGTNDGSGSLVFTPNQTSVTFNYTQNQLPPAQTITVTAAGQYTGNLYVLVTMTGQGGIASNIPITVTGYTATAQISVVNDLTPGTYTGQLNFLVCSDAGCDHQIGNSPIAVSYSITVNPAPPVLQLSPANVAVTAASGTTPTQVVAIAQFPQGQTTFTTAIESGSPWLTITNPTASSFTVAFASMPSGIYTGQVQVTSGDSTLPLIVTYTVTPPAGGDVQLTANPTSLTLSTVEDATVSATLGVTPPSWNPQVTVTAEYPTGAASGWLTLTPATGGGYLVVANAGTLSAGSYSVDIRLHGAYPSTDVVVPVALTVGPGLVRPANVSLTATAETTAAALSGSVPVNVVAGPPAGWSATSSASWLVLTTSSGETGQSLTYAIDPAQLGLLPNAATYTATINVLPTIKTMTGVAFNVTLSKNLPQITSVGPYVQLTGQPARVILRGSGFDAVASLTNRVTMQGATTSSATLVNDTEVVATFSALTAGTYTVSVSNALGLSTGTGTVLAVNAPTYAYGSVPTFGALRSLAYDPERGSLYAANIDAQSVMSFHYSGTAWASTSVPLPAAFDVGLRQDGAALVATSSPATAGGTVELLDPATLSTLQSTTLTGNFQPTFTTLGFGIPTTNDGRSWLAYSAIPTGGEEFGTLAYVTPGSLTPTVLTTTNASYTFLNGPWFAMSRDGERLIITQSASVSPQPPMLYLNAADSVIHTNPAGLTWASYYSLSENAGRLLLNNLTLYDGSFDLIGAATIPAAASGQPGYGAVNGQVAPDGTRVYVLAYRSDAATNTAVTPRVFVFDATTTQTNLSVLGYFDIQDYPGDCVLSPYGPPCVAATVAGAIALDGRTLFFGGNQRVVIAPVPSTLSTVTSVARGLIKQQRRPATTLWPVNVH